MKKVLLAGNAVTAEILYAYLAGDARYSVAALVVDDAHVASASLTAVPSVPFSRVAGQFPPQEYTVIMAAGYADLNRTRESMFLRIRDMGYTLETYIHPDARVYTQNPIGEGTLIFPGAVVEPHCQIGANCMIWCNVTVAHHASVGDHCWLAAGAVISGKGRVERNSFVGVNATVVNDITVSEYTIVGGAAFITKKTAPYTVHLARSAEQLRYTAEEYVKYFGV